MSCVVRWIRSGSPISNASLKAAKAKGEGRGNPAGFHAGVEVGNPASIRVKGAELAGGFVRFRGCVDDVDSHRIAYKRVKTEVAVGACIDHGLAVDRRDGSGKNRFGMVVGEVPAYHFNIFSDKVGAGEDLVVQPLEDKLPFAAVYAPCVVDETATMRDYGRIGRESISGEDLNVHGSKIRKSIKKILNNEPFSRSMSRPV